MAQILRQKCFLIFDPKGEGEDVSFLSAPFFHQNGCFQIVFFFEVLFTLPQKNDGKAIQELEFVTRGPYHKTYDGRNLRTSVIS